MRITHLLVVLAPCLLCACIGGSKGTATNTVPPTPTVNTLAVVVDAGPAGATSMVNNPYVTVHVCAAGSTTQCANIDHIRLDTGSWGLRLVRSVLAASAPAITLIPETDAQGLTIEECLHFGLGDTWGPVALADVSLAGEAAAKVPVQVLDDTKAGAPAPATCGLGGAFANAVADIQANGLLGVGVFAQDCGQACANAATPQPLYYGCTSAGVCTAENVALTAQVTNPVAMFAADNNGIIVNMPNLQNANGDSSVTGELIIGLGTQTDNALPATGLTVLGADATTGDFNASYSGGAVQPALIDSGQDDYSFNAGNDPNLLVCPASAGIFSGYYCPVTPPAAKSTVNMGAGVNSATNTVQFAIADPRSFVAGATAFTNLAGGGGATRFTWGMPFFYGRKVYIGIEAKASGTYTGPYYAY